jgi:hypothetical protein
MLSGVITVNAIKAAGAPKREPTQNTKPYIIATIAIAITKNAFREMVGR